MTFPTCGLYAITQTDRKSSDTVIQDVYSAIKGGASVIQYRDKNPEDAVYLAKQLLNLCKQHNVPLLINDDAELAHRIGADGVHIGKDDGGIASARKILGSKAIIGISCYNDINIALQAEANGVDYVAFGRFFPSTSKPLAAPAQIETLQQAKKQIKLPIVAIGGILPDNGEQLLTAGADILAVIGGIFEHNPEQSAQSYMKLFNS
ncbi:MAG: thiamine phosphate synthase [Methylomarinum sp.]|nr:thiamine phosphate synthase [Methylomarinum sp.]